jgi:hypothetical protein
MKRYSSHNFVWFITKEEINRVHTILSEKEKPFANIQPKTLNEKIKDERTLARWKKNGCLIK